MTLAIDGLRVSYPAPRPGAAAPVTVDGVSLRLAAGSMLGLVGESGCGKSQTALAALGLLPAAARIEGRLTVAGLPALDLSGTGVDAVRGRHIGLVPQNPLTALNPYRRLGAQFDDVLGWHRRLRGAAARAEALAVLDAVRVPDARRRLDGYLHECSGGQAQRLLIALALAAEPAVLIADEPTTALDARVQAEVLALFDRLRAERGLAVLLITHDLGVVARHCDRVAVMYAGRIVEHGPTGAVLTDPRHPYTAALLATRPRMRGPRPMRLPSIPGQPPDPAQRPRGCAYAPRCERALPVCGETSPTLAEIEENRGLACSAPVPHARAVQGGVHGCIRAPV